MRLAAQTTLFEPAGASPIGGSLDWIGGLVFGQVALGLCVLAVAFVGALMLTGRLPLREGMRVVVGCFILLGAPAIAAGLLFGERQAVDPAPLPPVPPQSEAPRGDLPPADYDPYAGASLRGD